MLRHFQRCFPLYSFAGMCLMFTPVPARAANVTFQGLFTRDDQVQLFDVFVDTPSLVHIQTFGYAGGMAATGINVPAGGFDPILTLFDAAGNFLTDNDDSPVLVVDPATGRAADASITLNLTAGNFIVALTQFDNFSIGDLADGFVYSGNPNFTADPAFTAGGPCPGGMFRDISDTPGRCRDGSWTVDFLNVASVTPRSPSSVVPEPATMELLGSALAAFGLVLRRRSAASGRPARQRAKGWA